MKAEENMEQRQGPEKDLIAKDLKISDFSDYARVEIPEASKLARAGKFDEALILLLSLEKRARLGGDVKTVTETTLVIIKLCFELRKWGELNANITLLCKRRSQFKNVQISIIQEAAERVPNMTETDEKEKIALIHTLRNVSEGKIFVEADRARLTYQLAMIKERDGDVSDAADILQEENVETYGAMSKREKLNFLLEQIRLCLAKKDFIRAYIITKKVNRKQLEDVELEDLKIRFYRLLIEYYSQEKDPLELARAHIAIFHSPGVLEEPGKWFPELQSGIIFLCISPFDNHQIDLVHNMLLNDIEWLDKLPEYKALLEHFVSKEISQWPLPEHAVITQYPLLKDGASWTFKMLRDRVIEHDIRVVASYYTQIQFDKLSNMLRLTKDETERYISNMISSTASERLVAKIDRPAGVVSFTPRQNANDLLTEWSDNISDLLSLVDKTTHLIHKEAMLANSKR